MGAELFLSKESDCSTFRCAMCATSDYRDTRFGDAASIGVNSRDLRTSQPLEASVAVRADSRLPNRSLRRMKSELALQFPPQPIDDAILLDRCGIAGGERFCFVHLAV